MARVGGSPLDSALVARLYESSAAARWPVPIEAFEAALIVSVERTVGDPRLASPDAVASWASALHVDDLALATACAHGHERAWEHFVAEYQPLLRRAAEAMDRTGHGRDLADALFADLYGLTTKDGVRQSLFRYFHGRSRLGTWLRAILSQRLIDRVRAGRRLDPLPDNPDELPRAPRAAVEEHTRFRPVVARACTAAIAELEPRDRLRLSCYYAQGMKLAAIGRMLREHEATVSRHLSRTRATIREAVAQRLRAEYGFDDRALAECFEAVAGDPGEIDLATLLGTRAARKMSPVGRSEE